MTDATTFAALMTSALHHVTATDEAEADRELARARELAAELLSVTDPIDLVASVARAGMGLSAAANQKAGLDPRGIAFAVEADVMIRSSRDDDQD